MDSEARIVDCLGATARDFDLPVPEAPAVCSAQRLRAAGASDTFTHLDQLGAWLKAR